MSFRVGLSVDTKKASISEAVALGAESLEIFVPPDLKWETDARALRETLAETGLPYTVHTFLTAMLAHEDPGIRSQVVAKALEIVDFTAAIGAPVVTFHPATTRKLEEPAPVKVSGGLAWFIEQIDYHVTVDLEESFSATIESFRAFCRRAGEHGIAIGLENIDYSPLFHPRIDEFDDIVRVLEAVDSPHLKLCLDVCHAQISDKPPQEWIHALGREIAHVHVSDTRGRISWQHGHLEIGDGYIDWRGVIEALEAVGYDGNMTVEARWDNFARSKDILTRYRTSSNQDLATNQGR
ncbi:MAG: sugar phosphate isomerase/epimerase family protein [Syntrophothermus sp.]